MSHALIMVLGVTALLGLVSLLLPLAEKLAIPYAVLLAGVGIALGTTATTVIGRFSEFVIVSSAAVVRGGTYD
jgi:CPA1 family monovalent cation:H+ antiporter